jgi:GH25 family lysozyme M1 (1,4-beta-N-acetylmuramidase)
MLRGLDVSVVQGIVPFHKLTDLSFCYAKSVEGNDGLDPYFFANVKAGQAAGKLMGAYYFLFPLRHIDPRKQVRLFWDQSRGFGSNVGELPPMLDFEWPAPEQWRKWNVDAVFMCQYAKAVCEEMTANWGCKPTIYIYPYFLDCLIRDGGDTSWMSEYDLTIADYSHAGSWPKDDWKPRIKQHWPWKDWRFCQIDGNGGMRLPNGVDSDFMIFNGDMKALREIAGIYDEKEPPFNGPIVTNRNEMIEELVARRI